MSVFKQLKMTTLVAGLILATSAVHAQSTLLPDVNWQQNAAQIKHDHAQLPEEENQRKLSYLSQLFDMDFHQEYIFNNDQLVEVLYYKSFDTDADNCVSAYRQVKTKLEQQYGKTETAVNTQKDVSELPEQTLCRYSAKGEYFLNSQWQNNNATIGFVLNSWKGQSYLGLSYRPLASQ